MAGDDDPLGLEVQVGPLDGDDADVEAGRKCPDRREFFARRPVARGNARPDLLQDLEVHRARVGLGDLDAAVHTVYTQHILSSRLGGSPPRKKRPRATRPPAGGANYPTGEAG